MQGKVNQVHNEPNQRTPFNSGKQGEIKKTHFFHIDVIYRNSQISGDTSATRNPQDSGIYASRDPVKGRITQSTKVTSVINVQIDETPSELGRGEVIDEGICRGAEIR